MRRLPQVAPGPEAFSNSKGQVLHDLIAHAHPTLDDGRYLHWDELRRREPPRGVTPEQWWGSFLWARDQVRQPVAPMREAYGIPFGFASIPAVQHGLHRFDRENVAKLLGTALGDKEAVTEYRIRQLLEEAISSSLIEGARPTTREVARQMVREKRPPISHDERMIVNNWKAMQRIVELRDEKRPLCIDDLKELHRILGEGALDVPGTEGVFRKPGDRVRVEDSEGNVWHVPPDADGLVDRMDALLRFVEDRDEPDGFVHPILRAIIAHFWLAYEHPFRDGNGRMARALFYWCMLRRGYEIAEFLSISGPIDRKPHAYYLAFAYTETDHGDLTYFILHQLEVLSAAIKELEHHLRERAARVQELGRLVTHSEQLNHRQRALLQHAIHHPMQSYTIKGHASAHGVHYNTAAADLADLTDRRLMTSKHVGKGKRFYLAPRLKQRLGKHSQGGSR